MPTYAFTSNLYHISADALLSRDERIKLHRLAFEILVEPGLTAPGRLLSIEIAHHLVPAAEVLSSEQSAGEWLAHKSHWLPLAVSGLNGADWNVPRRWILRNLATDLRLARAVRLEAAYQLALDAAQDERVAEFRDWAAKALRLSKNFDDAKFCYLLLRAASLALVHERSFLAERLLKGVRKLLPLENTSKLRGHFLATWGKTMRALGRPDEAKQSFELAARIGRTIGDLQLTLSAQLNMALELDTAGEFQAAIHAYREGLEICQIFPQSNLEEPACTNLGYCLRLVGKLEEARAFFLRALALCERRNNPRDLANKWLNLGSICSDLGEPAQGLVNIKKAFDLYSSVNARAGMVMALTSMAFGYLELEEVENAKGVLRRAGALMPADCPPDDYLSYLEANSQVYEADGSYIVAMDWNEQALELANRLQMNTFCCFALATKGSILLHSGRFNEAIESCMASQEIAENAGLTETPGYLHNLATWVAALLRRGDKRSAQFIAADAKDCLAKVRAAKFGRRSLLASVHLLEGLLAEDVLSP